MKSNKKVNLATIGVGHLGQHHARIYSEHENCELVGIIDNDKEQAGKISEKYGVSIIDDYHKLLNIVDAVSIATPTVTHYEIAKFFLQNAVHVLVEKPISTTVKEGEELVALAKKNNLIFQVGHLERFNAAVVEAKNYIKSPGFIETQRLGAFSPRSLDIDVILDLMIHDIDIVSSLVKSPVSSISAVGVPVLTDKIDIASVRLIFENGCVANLTASRASLEATRKIRIFQNDLYLSIDYAAQHLSIARRISPKETSAGSFPQITKEEVPVTPREPLRAEIDSFLQCIQSGGKPMVSGEDGLIALRIAYQILDCIN